MCSKLSASSKPVFGFVGEQRLTKGSRGVIAKVTARRLSDSTASCAGQVVDLVQHADGSFDVEVLSCMV